MCRNVFPARNGLVINHLGRLFVTSDAATAIRKIGVFHPAAELLVMASQAQECDVSLPTGHEDICFVSVVVAWLCTALPQPSRLMTVRPNLVALGRRTRNIHMEPGVAVYSGATWAVTACTDDMRICVYSVPNPAPNCRLG